jgi:integrase
MHDADLAHWATRPASDITRAELVDVLNLKSNRGHLVASNRLRALISRIYRHAVQSGRIAVVDNPVEGTKKHGEKKRERVLSFAEIQRVWAACDELPLHQRVWFRLRLVTGQRSADLIQMRWADLDSPKKHFWNLPGAFTKNQLPHTVYLASLAQELLAQLPRRVEDGPFDPVWVFPAGGNGNNASLDVMGDYPKIARRLAQPSRANIVVATPETKRCKRGWKTRLKADFTGHDLRRTMTTIASGGGITNDLLGHVLNHRKKSGDVTGSTYNQNTFNSEKKAIMQYWDKQLRCILAGGDHDALEAMARFTMDSAAAALQLENAEAKREIAELRAMLALRSPDDVVGGVA